MGKSKTVNERKQWFLDRVGKTLFNTLFCDCEICRIYYEKGSFIKDEESAKQTYTFESDLQAEGTKLKYFDTKEERTAYEKENLL